MKKCILSAMMVLCLLLCFLPVDVRAEDPYLKSGDLNAEKLTREEIVELLEHNTAIVPENRFDEEPSCNAPYSTGKVSDELLQAMLNRLNVMRKLAGVPLVELSEESCENAQYGAVIIAKLGYLDHYPDQPEDMDDDFYEKAYSATSSSNLAAGYSPVAAIDGFMDDSDSSNITSVGHRSWQLNPTMATVGFGYAETRSGYRCYVAEKVFDTSGEGCEYDFYSWPASGYFPNNTMAFDYFTAWSIHLNSDVYGDASDVRVILSRESDGTTWTFEGSYEDTSERLYFNAQSSKIIFRPDNIEKYEGVYTVKVEGLTYTDGTPADFAYQVTFFDASDYVTTVNAKDATCTEAGYTGDVVCSVCGELKSTGSTISALGHEWSDWVYTEDQQSRTCIRCGETKTWNRMYFTDVPVGSYYEEPVLWAVENNITGGTSATTFSPKASCTRGQIVTFLWAAAGRPEPTSDTNPFTDVKSSAYYYKAVLWAVENGITGGTSATTFSPNNPCTRGQVVTFLWAAKGRPEPESTSNTFFDVKSSDYYYKAVLWAVENGITSGIGYGQFGPGNTCTRGQIVTFLYKAFA